MQAGVPPTPTAQLQGPTYSKYSAAGVVLKVLLGPWVELPGGMSKQLALFHVWLQRVHGSSVAKEEKK